MLHPQQRDFGVFVVESLHEIEIQNGAAVHAEEVGRGQAFFPRAEGLSHEESLARNERELGVIILGGDGDEVVDAHEMGDAGAGLRLHEVVGLEEVGGGGGLDGHGEADPAQGLGETGGADGFEEIIEGVDLEGAQREVVGGGNKNRVRAGRDVRDEVEAGTTDELHVEEDGIVVGGLE